MTQQDTIHALMRDLLAIEGNRKPLAAKMATMDVESNRLKGLLARALGGYEVEYEPAPKPVVSGDLAKKMEETENRWLGRTFGAWTVIGRGRNARHWICRCKCGKKRDVQRSNLLSGASTKCRSCAATEVNQRRKKAAV